VAAALLCGCQEVAWLLSGSSRYEAVDMEVVIPTGSQLNALISHPNMYIEERVMVLRDIL
jgi:hypothetical protein